MARRYHLGYAGEAPLHSTDDEADVLSRFESIVRLDVAAASDPWVFVHAGVVGWRGRAIVLPAPSRHGKSTLVAALVRAGAIYYSDEYAVLDPEGRVHPFAKPMSLRLPSGTLIRRTATDLGGTVGVTPLPLGVMLSTWYRPASPWHPHRIPAAAGVLALLANCVRARTATRQTLASLARAVDGAMLLEGARGEADGVATQILRLFEHEHGGALDHRANRRRDEQRRVGLWRGHRRMT